MKKTTHSILKTKKKIDANQSNSSLFPSINSSQNSINTTSSIAEVVQVNQQLIRNIANLRAENNSLLEKNDQLIHHIDFLESIFSGLQFIVSIRDLKQNNLLWHNDNFRHILGYRHKELQDINSNVSSTLYHPDDIKKLKLRRNCFENDAQMQHYNCMLRLKDKHGRWISFNADWKVIKRDAENKPLWVLETLSDAAVVNVNDKY